MSKQQISEAIASEEDWAKCLELSTNMLIVADVHKAWCGPCTVIEPTQRRLYLEYDNAEKRLKFVTINTGLGLKEFPESDSCKPKFMLFKNKQLVSTVNGANAPEFISQIKQHIPPNPEEETQP